MPHLVRFSSLVMLFSRIAALALVAQRLPASDIAPPPERYPLEHYLKGLAEEQWRAREVAMASIQTAVAVKARGEHVRAQFLQTIGQLPGLRTPLNARITGTLERKGYRVEKLIYESLPGCHVTANLYVPTTGRGPYPAVLGAAGHAQVESKAAEAYQKAWIGLALQGYVVLAYDPPAQGERFELLDPATGAVTPGSHISAGLQCLLTGGTVARYFLWDGIRGLDYLLTRPEVDGKRIAAAGNSGGGTQSAFLAVVEPRLAAAAPSCYWTSWPTLWDPMGPQDSEQVLPGWVKLGYDFSDLAIAFAPKPITILTATRDAFPVQGARTMHAEAKRMYALLGAESALGYFEFDDTHGWSQPRREACIAWFNRWLYGRYHPVEEPDIQVEPVDALRCTETGQVITSFQSKTSQLLNLEVAEALYSQRTLRNISSAGEARATVAGRLALASHRSRSATKPVGHSTHAEFAVETHAIFPAPAVDLRIQIVIPTRLATSLPAIIILRDYASPVDPETDAEVAAWRQAGHVVIVAPLRGLPMEPEKKLYFTTNYRTAMRALLVGKTIAGMRVEDLLAVFSYAASRPDIIASRISILGRGNMGIIAQYAAALEPKIDKVIAAETLLSYMDAVRAPHLLERYADIIVPSALLDYDLPDLVAIGGKGRVVLVNPVSACSGGPADETARMSYGTSVKVLVTTAPITPQLIK